MTNLNTVEGKKAFVEGLVERIKQEVFDDIEKMPDEWDGHHLRVMLAEKFKSETGFDGCKKARRQIRKSSVKYEFKGYYG